MKKKLWLLAEHAKKEKNDNRNLKEEEKELKSTID